jgi:hypothetical protein
VSTLVLLIYGVPAFIASIPGLVALGHQRRLLGWLMIAGAVVVTIPVAIFLDRWSTRAMAEDGVIDNWAASLLLPFFLGVLYLLAATIGYAVCALLTKRRVRPSE